MESTKNIRVDYNSKLELKLDTFHVGDKVLIKVQNLRSSIPNSEHWVDGIVTDKRMQHSTYGSKHIPYPMFTVKYTQTYYKK